jgi:hypothetical protein
MNALEAFNHVGLLLNGPVAAATCPSSSHPTHILIGAALRFWRTDQVHSFYVAARVMASVFFLSPVRQRGGHAGTINQLTPESGRE